MDKDVKEILHKVSDLLHQLPQNIKEVHAIVEWRDDSSANDDFSTWKPFWDIKTVERLTK